MSTIPRILDTFAELSPRYDLLLCDVWGVLHNGVAAFQKAGEALIRHRAAGGAVVLLTNAPRPSPSVARQLAGLGVPEGSSDLIVSSGDVTRSLLEAHAGRPIYHLGPERDRVLLEGLSVRPSPEDLGEAIVCSGLFDDTRETPEDYREQLARLARRGLPMICANPDIMVERGDSLSWCAGALARDYEAIGGQVSYAGKPHRPIYDLAIARIEAGTGRRFARERTLAIGDGIPTDMAGAAAFGIDALFILSGVHQTGDRPLDNTLLEELFRAHSFRPVAAIRALCW